ncbi:MAG TPA: 16S rRNA (cytidine(1402)-2'-O)-methyltransferase [Methylophaga aminisulfidivorans]|uniref:16S rRNA (cytidine(1402)-2'-O)-methyltransferase n=1 Tax=Methylophaga TaxID=40222 RepID=UPI0017796B28|nr:MULTISPECIES: 16S rRNA (cytidine(1402)-2'-O)-methyltransferase [Methylophaga]HIC45544.1 16S rRNA (cytidine(1402)-2'-O)-methyltransferase [Methylophaga sp.]HIM40970.1 16S rRNA (cytidine(1402)-2'-O)-methyltransferase [Methylophaga aminisulfidivorans]
MNESQAGQLFIVATPIGNLADFSARAIEVLKSVDVIAAEDTRHSKYLLQHYAIQTSTISLHEHNEQQRSDALCQRLLAGESVALISDAGTPLISDPGYRLVTTVRDAGIRVIPIPGCCALITALSASGLASDRFSFEGFLPAKSSARKQLMESLKSDARTLIFYESPRRLLAALEDAVLIFGEQRQACLARELTKLHETIETRPLIDLIDWVKADDNQQRGECVLLIEGSQNEATADEQEVSRLLKILLTELPVKKAAAMVANITGGSKNEAYQLALKLQQKN